MKTVVDAVNELRADAKSGEYTTLVCDPGYGHLGFDGDGDWVSCVSYYDGKVCTVEEFNQCVAEMSAWQPTLKGDDVKTVTVDGMVYEIGKLYEFSTDGVNWVQGIFKKPDDCQIYQSSIRECQSSLGTITQTPVELVDGKAYMFKVNGVDMVARYSLSTDEFCLTPEIFYKASNCTNITPLIPEAK